MGKSSIRDLVLDPKAKTWFVDSRFGMFIHWGLYALGARHEWLQNHEEITREDYRKYFEHFDPDLYDPVAWAKQARTAGMKYVVLTTKHHEGFCLFDSQYTDYKATNTPYGKDLVKPFVEAFRAEGLKIGFYYSLIDWHHDDFTIDIHHPLRNREGAEALNNTRDMSRYVAYMRHQVTELLTNYGKIDIMWFDFSYPQREWKGKPGKGHMDWRSEELVRLVRSLQSDVIINNRLDLIGHQEYLPDITTPEQYTPRTAPLIKGESVTWEACHTFSGSWGYDRDEDTWKSPDQLIKMLIDTVSMGGNLLMNVGPTARGSFDNRALAALDVYANWIKLHGRAIYSAGSSDYLPPRDCRYTQAGNRLYLHIYSWPFRHIHVEGLGDTIKYAQFLHDGSEVQWLEPAKDVDPNIGVPVKDGSIVLELPVKKPDVTVPVVEIFLKN